MAWNIWSVLVNVTCVFGKKYNLTWLSGIFSMSIKVVESVGQVIYVLINFLPTCTINY